MIDMPEENDIVRKLYQQLEVLDAHPDFNESCTVMCVIEAIKEIKSIRAQASKVEPAPAPSNIDMRAELIARMADRLMGWKLPKDFSPDCGISFDGREADARGYATSWPTGTNLFSVMQARAMFEHLLADEPLPQPANAHITREKLSTIIESCFLESKPEYTTVSERITDKVYAELYQANGEQAG